MTENDPIREITDNQSNRRKKSKALPDGFTWLNIPVPTDVHTQLHHLARLAGWPLKAFVVDLLQAATSISANGSNSASLDHNTKKRSSGANVEESN